MKQTIRLNLTPTEANVLLHGLNELRNKWLEEGPGHLPGGRGVPARHQKVGKEAAYIMRKEHPPGCFSACRKSPAKAGLFLMYEL